MSDSNFDFMKNINPAIYEVLYSAEKQARTNFRGCGRDTREALEKIVGTIIKNNRLEQVIGRNLDLSTKLELLKDESVLASVGIDKPVLPVLGNVTVKYENGGSSQVDAYVFMRQFGNTCHHADNRPKDVKLSYKAVVDCLKCYYRLLTQYYKNRLPKNIPEFDADKMPIEEYHVFKSYVPDDRSRSKCEREFLAYTLDSDGEKNFYAVLRLYRKADVSENFLERNHRCFTIASRMSISSVPEGMTKMRELIPIDSDQSSFYIICYIFNREPHELSEALLKDMTLKQRIKLCCRIIDCLYNLHTSEVPIEHRMLNYESIFVCQFRDEWIPYVIKFDFAKIESSLAKGTVQKNLLEARQDMIGEKKLSKYLPPEWDLTPEPEKMNWAKVDIYSMGILFSDILMGKIGDKPVPIEDLEELDLSDEILDLLDIMRADDPESRFGISDVKAIFEDELRN